MPDVLALGDVNVDVIAHFPAFPIEGGDALATSTEFHCGGSAANVATALAWLGIDTVLIARVGPDPWAAEALRSLSEAGVSLGSLQHDPTVMTGLTYIIVTPDGERTILGHRGANAFTDPAQIREEEVQAARLLYLSGYALLTDPQRSAALLALEMARRHGLVVTLDPGLSVSQAVVDRVRGLLPAVDVLLPTLAEARQLTGLTAPGDCARALLDGGAGVVALKLGTDGCLVASAGGFHQIPGFVIEAQDSTGAGDSFAAALIAGVLHGLDWPSAAVLGNAMGAQAAVRVGAAARTPIAREVLAILRDHSEELAHRRWREALDRVITFVETLARESREKAEP